MEMIVVKSKIKEVADKFNVSGDFAEALNAVAIEEIKAALARAEANGRVTIGARDVFLGKKTAKTMLVVKSKIKEVAADANVSSDFSEALNEVLVSRVEQAKLRAEANSRKTIGSRDL